jgi:DNA topoisomerase I
VQLGEGEKPPRASIPKDAGDLDLALALKLLSLPRTVGTHPETGKPITASIGRYGPYLAHDGKYAKLGSTAEVFETGMNAAVVKLAAPKGERKAAAPLREFGPHPANGNPIRLMEGRYGAYVTDGTTNATLPKTADPQTLTLDEAAALLDARAAAGPPKGKRKAAPKKKPAAKKAAPKKPAKKKA